MTLEKRAENTAGIQVVLKKLFFFSLAFSLFILIDRVAITLADLWLQGSFKYTWLTAHHAIQIFLALAVMVVPVLGPLPCRLGVEYKKFPPDRQDLGEDSPWAGSASPHSTP